jgi:hypothetical protein
VGLPTPTVVERIERHRHDDDDDDDDCAMETNPRLFTLLLLLLLLLRMVIRPGRLLYRGREREREDVDEYARGKLFPYPSYRNNGECRRRLVDANRFCWYLLDICCTARQTPAKEIESRLPLRR